jgi:hypothetical protein
LIVDHSVDQAISADRPEWMPVFTGLSVEQLREPVRIVADRGGDQNGARPPPSRWADAADPHRIDRTHVRTDGKVLVMALHGPELVQYDGDARYRVDTAGTRAVVVPATCRRGLHRLAGTGYRVTEADGVLRVRCNRCASAGDTDHSWIFRSAGPLANIAELDDTAFT